MYCKNCGKEIESGADMCHECKRKNNEKKGKFNYLGVVGLVIAICSLFMSHNFDKAAFISLIVSVVGICVMVKNKERGKGFAIAACVIDIVVLAVVVIEIMMFGR